MSFAALALLTVASGCGPRPVSSGPAIRFSANRADAGTIQAGDKKQVSFKVRNAGGAPLRIDGAVGDCGCITSSFPKLLKPGESGEILATYEPLPRAGGTQERRIHVVCNDPAQPAVDLVVAARVIPYVSAQPGMVVQQVRAGKSYTQEVLLTPRAGSKLKISDARSTDPAVRVQLLPPDARDAQGSYRLKLSLGPFQGIGDWNSRVTFKTTEKKLPEYEVGVAALSLDGLVVGPKEISIPSLPQDASAEKELRRIQVFKREGSLHILKVDSGNPALKVKVETKTAKQFYELVLMRAGKWASGQIKSTIRIQTDDKQHPVASVPFDATVQ